MPSLYGLAKAQRRRLNERDARLAAEVVSAYGARFKNIKAAVSARSAEIDATRARGEVMNVAWLARSWRYQQLIALTQAEVRGFSAEAERLIERARSEAFALAAADTRELLAAAEVAARESPALAELALGAADRERLKSLLEPFAEDAFVRVRKAVRFNLAQEQTAAALERAVTDGLGAQLTHALTISRTEHIQAYREAARRARLANREDVYAWTWAAELSATTCPLCWAMHGTVHDVEESLDSHPNCRCQAVPMVLGASEAFETGEEMFALLSEKEKREILGEAAYEAYRAGKIRLRDLVGVKKGGVWGRSRYVRSLKSVLG